MDYFKDKILPGLLTTILLAILGALIKIYLVVDGLPTKFEINDQQHEQFITMIQNEMDKRYELEKKLLILETKLER
jgi:hypothetical protein